MKRDFLQNLRVGDQPLPKEVIDAIMEENGRDIEAAKKPFADYETIKDQLAQAQETIRDGNPTIAQIMAITADEAAISYLQQARGAAPITTKATYSNLEKNDHAPLTPQPKQIMIKEIPQEVLPKQTQTKSDSLQLPKAREKPKPILSVIQRHGRVGYIKKGLKGNRSQPPIGWD